MTTRRYLVKQLVPALVFASGLTAAGIAGVLAASITRIGRPAPAFTATTADGRTLSIADLKGKTVVLEWTNHECPFVMKHYGARNMQALQSKWTGKGVVWLAVISSAPGEQGHVSGSEATVLMRQRGGTPTAVLLDPEGTIGRAYGAQTTPHMYVINPEGKLAYMGGIDDKPTARQDDIRTARNFVDEALTAVTNGKAVEVTTARPYGCSVKYAS